MAEDIAEAITRVENVLRDLIEETLRDKYGDEWLDHLGASEDQLGSWRRKQQEDRRRRGTEVAEDRLLYYADLHDLAPALKKDWPLFSSCLGDWKEIEIYLGRLDDLRHPKVHGRTLLPFEDHLVLGISGDIRQRVTVYKSRQSAENEFFARIESVRDSLGNVLCAPGFPGFRRMASVIHVGDQVIFSCNGWDPNGQPLQWRLDVGMPRPRRAQDWTTDDNLVWDVSQKDIGRDVWANISMRSQAQYHAAQDYDDLVSATYTVLPAGPRQS